MVGPAWMQTAIVAAGVGQLIVALGSLRIPFVLRWREDVASLRPLTRQVFWTYAGYIWATNVSFGVVSLIGSAWLLDGSPLAAAVTGFVTLYWLARIVIQFTYFDRSDAPSGALFVVAEIGLVAMFVAFTAVYGYAVVLNSGAG